jgi:hypothetical protein
VLVVNHLAAGLLCLMTLTAACAGGSRDERPFLDRLIDAHGGVEAVRGTKALVQRGTTVAAIRGGEGPVTRSWADGLRFAIELGREGRPPERRVLAGSRGWRDGKPATGPLYSSMVLQAARIVLPKLLLEHRDRVEDLGLHEEEGLGRVHVLRLDLGHGLSVLAECDPATARIRRSRGLLTFGEQSMEFGAVYSDYRTLPNGLVLAFREEHLAMGAATGHTQLESVELLDALPEGALAP